MAKYIVTIAPPTPNGNLHLGHISGPFLAADIFARVRRIQNDEVFFTSYSDDYQDYVARKAVELGKDKFELAAKYSAQIAATLKKVDIEVDHFMHSHDNDYYKEAVKFLYLKALEEGAIRSKKTNVPFSAAENQYGYEAFARGTCNYCGVESDASQCESCANSPVLEKMGEMKSVFTNEPMDFVEKEREYLTLGNYKDFLRELYENTNVRESLKLYIDRILNGSELDWFIDRPGGHGIDLQINGAPKTIHTWFSGLAGYLGASKEYWDAQNQPEMHDYFWKDKTTQIVNFLGFDCSFSHAIVYPSLLANLNNHTTNVTPLTNKFLKLEGGDFSTSRNHAIWVDDLVKDYAANGIRFYLALASPEEQVKNFEIEKFTHWYTNFFEQKLAIVDKVVRGMKDFSMMEEKWSELLEDQAVNRFYETWRYYASMEKFSIGRIARCLQDMLLYIESAYHANDERIEEMVMLYLALANPLHPGLHAEKINNINLNKILRNENTTV